MEPIPILDMINNGFIAFNKLVDGITLIGNEIKRANDNAWFQQKADAFKPLESGPTTEEQKDEAAKNIGDLIHKL